MADNPRIKTDTQRVEAGASYRAKTNADGVPAHLDFEETPPPHAVPSLADLPQDDQLRMLERASVANTEGLQRLWGARHNAEKLDRILETVATHGAILSQMEPFLRGVNAHTESLETSYTKIMARMEQFFDREWPRFERAVNSLDERMNRFETNQIQVIGELKAAQGASNLATQGLDQRVKTVELALQILKDERTERIGGDKRQLKLMGSVAGGGSVLGALITELIHYFSK